MNQHDRYGQWEQVTQKYINISGFTLTNIVSTNRFTWTNIVSTNRFTWTHITGLNRFCWMNIRTLTRPYRGRLTAPSQLKLAEYFPNWVFPKFLNPIKLKNIIGSLFILAVISYSLTMIIYWLQYYIKITKTTLVL